MAQLFCDGWGRIDLLGEELLRVARKYRLMVELAPMGSGEQRTLERRAALREVASFAPGALREWESHSPELLMTRMQRADMWAERCRKLSLDVARELSQKPYDYVAASLLYHPILRALLAIRLAFPGRHAPDLAALRKWIAEHCSAAERERDTGLFSALSLLSARDLGEVWSAGVSELAFSLAGGLLDEDVQSVKRMLFS